MLIIKPIDSIIMNVIMNVKGRLKIKFVFFYLNRYLFTSYEQIVAVAVAVAVKKQFSINYF